MFVQDFVLNGQGYGQVGEMLSGCRFDPGMLRPYIDRHGQRCVTINSGQRTYDEKLRREVPIYRKARITDLQANGINSPVFNATALRKEEWDMLDRVVLRAARYRLRAWADLAAANSFGGFNGMCFTGDTLVAVVGDRDYTFSELAAGAAGETFSVYSNDGYGRVFVATAKNVRKTGENVPLVRVTLDNDKSVRCTPGHLFMLRDGSYLSASRLQAGQSLMPFHREQIIGREEYEIDESTKEPISYRFVDVDTKDTSWVECEPVLFGDNHKVVSVESMTEREDVYDLEVPEYHNFSLSCGITVHNSKMILEHETMSDPGEAVVDMDGLTEGRTDSPQFQLQGLPLPITHSDFWFSSRRLAISRNTGTPLDTTMGEAAGRRVAEMIEKTTIGVTTGVTYGGNSTQVGGYGRTSSVYGYTNFPARLTKTNLNSPTAGGYTPAKTLADVLAMRDALYLNKFYGPFMLYHSNDWDQYMDNDYILTGGNVATQTLRERLKAIEGITDVRRLDFLFGTQLSSASGPGTDVDATLKPFTLLMVQMTPDVARAVNGQDITTVQWESVGGMRLNFKVMCIQVPQLRADFYGNCGILHATTS